jgi:hypothetical protein
MVKKSCGKIKTILTNNDKIFKFKGKEFRFVNGCEGGSRRGSKGRRIRSARAAMEGIDFNAIDFIKRS